tara:strand:- start:278 stop:1204 length:927 start_codon:yes stop_codon:yes gene_type:complete
MSGDEEQNIIQELNARFSELRTLMITIGSVIAMLIAGLNEVGFINFAVDTVVDLVEDDPDLNPYIGDCEENWGLVVDHFVIENDVLFHVHIMDLMWCNNIHTVAYNISLDGKEELGTSPEFRNQHQFVVTIEDLSEGTHRAYIQVSNGSIDLFKMLHIDFEYDEVEMEDAIYGCTNSTALNYNESATHDDGTCEYPQEEEEITENCYAYIYDAISYWADNNTSIYNEFDVDFSCQANITFTMNIELLDSFNNTLGQEVEDNFSIYHQEWDFQYLDFYNTSSEYDAHAVNFNLFYDGELADSLWYRIEA